MRIEICGGIAAGKTTLASVLTNHNLETVYEDFTKNPFWNAFFTDPDLFAFETELTFLLLHYHQLKLSTTKRIVCDYCFTQDASYADLDLTGIKKRIFVESYDEVMKELGQPDLIVHLTCSPEIQLQRIKARARSEEASVSIEFLENLNVALVARLNALIGKVKIITIDSSVINFSKSAVDKKDVVNQVISELDNLGLGIA